MHPHAELTGYLAAALTTLSFVPQVWKTLRTRDTRAISLGMYLMFSAGVALWLVYGVLIGAWPVILANGATLVLTSTVLWHKLRERPAASLAESIQPGDLGPRRDRALPTGVDDD
jgi:MtN3 and saliva related transmembrane protein